MNPFIIVVHITVMSQKCYGAFKSLVSHLFVQQFVHTKTKKKQNLCITSLLRGESNSNLRFSKQSPSNLMHKAFTFHDVILS